MTSRAHNWVGLWVQVVACALAGHAWGPAAAETRQPRAGTAGRAANFQEFDGALAAIRASAAGDVLIVDCHGGYDFTTIQDAIDSAANGDKIVVLPNTCTPGGAYFERIDFLGKAITVQSVFPDDPAVVAATIIDGNQSGSVVTFQTGEAPESTLDGLTITHGRADAGAGIYCHSSGPTLSRCIVRANVATTVGGGLYSFSWPRPTVLGCTFAQNSAPAGGGFCAQDSEVALTDCTFINNQGGGLCSNAWIWLTNCTFTGNATNGSGGGAYCSGSAMITNCTFRGNTAATAGGGLVVWNRDLILRNCLFEANHTDGTGGGLQVSYGYSRQTIVGCVFSNNSAGQYGGAIAEIQCGPLMMHCTLRGNSAGHGGAIYHFTTWWDSAAVANCIMWDNVPEEIHVSGGSVRVTFSDVSGGWPGTGNLDVDPRFVGPGDYHLTPASRCVNAGDPAYVPPAGATDIDGDPRVIFGVIDMGADETREFADCNLTGLPDWQDVANGTSADANGNGAPDECEPNHLYVKHDAPGNNDGTSWTDAYRELHDALVYPLPNITEIWVAAGVLTPAPPGGDRTKSFALVNKRGLYGGFAGWETKLAQRDPAANLTVLSGDLNGDDGPDFAGNAENSYHVVTALNVDATAVLDGFTVTAGNANDDASTDYRRGGGLIVLDATVRDCVFFRNWATYGGGVYVDWHGDPTFRDCRFLANACAWDGAGVAATGSTAFLGCTFADNVAGAKGGGLRFVGDGPDYVTLRNCTFRNNRAHSGAGVYNDEYYMSPGAVIRGCLFVGNVASTYGGGLYTHFESAPRITNCTFSGNSAGSQGGGIYNRNSSYRRPTVTNSILWDNSGGSLVDFYPAYPTLVTYSDVQGGWQGDGNIDVDSQFVAPEHGDYHLAANSPCIDAGEPNFAPLPGETDMDGQFRVWDGDGERVARVDMGADEFGSFMYGDLNCDGTSGYGSLGDINPIVLALSNPSAYAAEWPRCDIMLADINGDGSVDIGDINPFVALLSGD